MMRDKKGWCRQTLHPALLAEVRGTPQPDGRQSRGGEGGGAGASRDRDTGSGGKRTDGQDTIATKDGDR